MTSSDKRLKRNINKLDHGIDFIQQLRPVTYQFSIGKDDQVYTGFIAQEVEQAAEKLDYDFSGVVPPASEEGHYGLRYAEFTVPLVKATQEQQAIIEAQQEEIEVQQGKIETLEDKVARLEALVEKLLPNDTEIKEKIVLGNNPNSQEAALLQNQPNPFSETTTIHYYIPSQTTNAIIRISNLNGSVIEEVQVEEAGEGTLQIEAGSLSAGNYTYTLMVDGKVVDTKQMVLTK